MRVSSDASVPGSYASVQTSETTRSMFCSDSSNRRPLSTLGRTCPTRHVKRSSRPRAERSTGRTRSHAQRGGALSRHPLFQLSTFTCHKTGLSAIWAVDVYRINEDAACGHFEHSIAVPADDPQWIKLRGQQADDLFAALMRSPSVHQYSRSHPCGKIPGKDWHSDEVGASHPQRYPCPRFDRNHERNAMPNRLHLRSGTLLHLC